MPAWPTYVMALAPFVVGFAVGLPRASWDGALAGLRAVRGKWLVFAAAFVRLAPDDWPGLSAANTVRARVLVQIAVLALFLALNYPRLTRRGRVGFGLVAAGAAANWTPMLLHGYMPFSAVASRASGQGEAIIAAAPSDYSVITEADRVAQVFGDVIPVPGLVRVVSIGDLLIALGLMVLVAVTVRGQLIGISRAGEVDEDVEVARA